MNIVLVGAGRLATNLGLALLGAGHCVTEVFSRTGANASSLALRLRAKAFTDISLLSRNADVYIVALSDNAIKGIIPRLCQTREDALFLHTAGSMPLTLFQGYAKHYGVLYPMQTFSKEKTVDFHTIPCFVEGNNRETLQRTTALAKTICRDVYAMTSAERQYLHIAAVFACNFANHCFALAEDVLQRHGLPFSVMLPLIKEAVNKVTSLSPRQAQTGPAVREDYNVIDKHLAMLQESGTTQEIYALLTRSIIEHKQQ